METQTKALLVASAVYACMVALSAAHVAPVGPEGVVGTVYRLVGELTGAYNSFGYFAPSVASQVRVKLMNVSVDGSTNEKVLMTGNTEVDLRLHTMMGFFPVPEAQQLFARSWAATALADPEVKETTVSVQVFELPTMAQYRNGERPTWKEFFRASYGRR